MKVLEDMNRCYGCAACYNICPTNTITMVAQSDGFLYPEINEEKCINCGACKKVCPHIHPQYDNFDNPKAYAVLASDEIRAKSASGGLFTLLADYVLEQGGFVCGAEFGDDFRSVHHTIISKKEDLDKLRRSKYLQSENGTIWREIKALLQNGKLVLYTGTPCQCAALKSFLGKSYDSLIIIDLICHSTPSPLAWSRYLDELSITIGSKEIQDVNFRYKGLIGWSSTLYIKYKTGQEYVKRLKEDPFGKAFQNAFISRKSCGKCQFARIPRQGDITIGDFWGVDNFDKKLNDKKGTSIIFVNSEKGQNLLAKLNENKVFKELVPVPFDKAVFKNSNVYHFPHSHPGRQSFFNALEAGKPFSTALDLSKKDKFDIMLFSVWYGGNYGSLLTNYALFNVLQDMGYKCCFADIPKQLWPNGKKHRDPKFVTRKFGNKYFPLTKRRATRTEFKELNNVADTFIVGSDQIWNYNLFKDIDTFFFLDFINTNTRKIAYGTSFGREKFQGDENARRLAGFYLNKFNAVSVREESGVDVCKNEFGVEAQKVLDPVFVCDKKYYLNAISESHLIKNPPKRKYILAYILDPNDAKQDAILNVAQNLDMDYVCIPNANVKETMRKNWELEYKENLDVEDWLYYFQNAEMVITDSFHGTCFSIIFERPFIAISNKGRGVDRFHSLLGEFNLMHHLVNDPAEITDNFTLLQQTVDYPTVNSIIQAKKQESIEWLKNALTKDIGAQLYSEYDILDKRMDTVDAKIDKKLEEVNTACSDLQGQIDKTASRITAENTALQTKIQEQTTRHDNLVEEYHTQNQTLQAKLSELSKRQDDLLKEYKAQTATMNTMLKTLGEAQNMLRKEQEANRHLLESKSFKIGRAITFIPRKIRDKIKKKK